MLYSYLCYGTGWRAGVRNKPPRGSRPLFGGCQPLSPPPPPPPPGATVALHLPSRCCGRPYPHHSFSGPGSTTRPTLHRPVSAERSRGPQCTHFYCRFYPRIRELHFPSHLPNRRTFPLELYFITDVSSSGPFQPPTPRDSSLLFFQNF